MMCIRFAKASGQLKPAFSIRLSGETKSDFLSISRSPPPLAEGVRGAIGMPGSENQARGLWQHAQLRGQRNAVFARQVDIEKDRVRTQLSTEAQPRLALCSRTDNLYLAGLVQQCRQVLSGQRLVLDNDSSDPDPLLAVHRSSQRDALKRPSCAMFCSLMRPPLLALSFVRLFAAENTSL